MGGGGASAPAAHCGHVALFQTEIYAILSVAMDTGLVDSTEKFASVRLSRYSGCSRGDWVRQNNKTAGSCMLRGALKSGKNYKGVGENETANEELARNGVNPAH